MIRDKIINLTEEDKPGIELFYDDNETPITREDYERAMAQIGNVCPMCGSHIYGYYAPFAERGIDAWCAECGYSHGDKAKIREWYEAHPEKVITCS